MVRIKHRYLLVYILSPSTPDCKTKNPQPTDKTLPDVVQFHNPSPDDLTPQLFARAIKDQVQYLYGDYGLGLVSSSLVVKYLSPATSTAIIRCSRNHYRLVWGALTFMTQLPNTPSQKQSRACVMQVVRVSGTIKKAEEEAIRRARAAILKARREGQSGGVDGLVNLLDEEEARTMVNVEESTSAGLAASDNEEEMITDSDENG